MRRIHNLFVIPVLGFTLVAAGCRGGESTASAAAPPPALTVDVAAVRARVADLESVLQLSGSLAPQARVAVHAKLPGTLSSVRVRIGDRVRQGDVVATLDRREIDAQVDAAAAAVNVARAGLESAEAALANAVLELDRAKNLFDKGAIPRQRLDGAETANRAAAAGRDLANANLAQAEAALRRAREVQRDTTLTSPLTGVVVERNYDAGNLVSPGSDKPVVAVADLRVMKLEAGVSELEAGRLRPGLIARVTAQAKPGQVFEGRLAAIAPEVDARNRHFQIEIRVDNADGALLSGMYATAMIPVERAPQAIVVPREAVTTRDGRRVVLKIEGDVVQAAPVQEGLHDGSQVQILSGLSSGDTVIADARRDVATGTRVRAVAQ
jgi:RND family efflux transporter MFP subunit